MKAPLHDRARLAQIYREARGFVLLSAITRVPFPTAPGWRGFTGRRADLSC